MCKNQIYHYIIGKLTYSLLFNMIKNILKAVCILVTTFSVQTIFAATIDHFELTVNPETVSVWEAVDLTIEAVDKDSNVIKDFEWTILIFSESDKDAELPNSLEEWAYTFKLSDEGHVKFENAIRFQNKWTNDIHVYDLSDPTDSILWIAEVQVTQQTENTNVGINILSPENWITIWKKEITISGKTKKNHQVKIILNGKKEIITTSNDDGIYEKLIEDLPNGKSILKAIVLDSDNEEIGSSKEVHITSDSSGPAFNKIKILPSQTLPAASNMTVEIYASKELSDVSIIMNDELASLEEKENWVYTVELLSPKTVWEYEIDVILKDELGHIIKELGAIKITTTELEAAEETTPKKKDKCSKWDFSGNVFDGKCWEKPKDYNAPMDLGIKDLKIVALKTKSVLTWLKLPDATKYEVYKKLEWEKIELIETVSEPRFEIAITWDVIKHEYFAVKAIWEKEFIDSENKNKKIKKEITWDLSEAIKIQTGPKEIILVMLALMLGFGVFLFKRRNV